jgi:hypothetical protein
MSVLWVMIKDALKVFGSILAVLAIAVACVTGLVFFVWWYASQPYEFTHGGFILWIKYGGMISIAVLVLMLILAGLMEWFDNARRRAR